MDATPATPAVAVPHLPADAVVETITAAAAGYGLLFFYPVAEVTTVSSAATVVVVKTTADAVTMEADVK